MIGTRAARGLFRYHPVLLFVAGALAVLVFQQGTIAILHAFGQAPPPFSYAASKPIGVPQIWSGAFWGGVWGDRLWRARAEVSEGAGLLSSGVPVRRDPAGSGLVVRGVPLRGLPMAAGWDTKRMIIHVIIHGMFGAWHRPNAQMDVPERGPYTGANVSRFREGDVLSGTLAPVLPQLLGMNHRGGRRD